MTVTTGCCMGPGDFWRRNPERALENRTAGRRATPRTISPSRIAPRRDARCDATLVRNWWICGAYPSLPGKTPMRHGTKCCAPPHGRRRWSARRHRGPPSAPRSIRIHHKEIERAIESSDAQRRIGARHRQARDRRHPHPVPDPGAVQLHQQGNDEHCRGEGRLGRNADEGQEQHRQCRAEGVRGVSSAIVPYPAAKAATRMTNHCGTAARRSGPARTGARVRAARRTEHSDPSRHTGPRPGTNSIPRASRSPGKARRHSQFPVDAPEQDQEQRPGPDAHGKLTGNAACLSTGSSTIP